MNWKNLAKAFLQVPAVEFLLMMVFLGAFNTFVVVVLMFVINPLLDVIGISAFLVVVAVILAYYFIVKPTIANYKRLTK